MARVAESLGVEIHEATRVLRIEPGRTIAIATEHGRVEAAQAVIATNGYTPQLGVFRTRLLPLCNYVVATEPLSPAQWSAIGWKGRQGLSDCARAVHVPAPHRRRSHRRGRRDGAVLPGQPPQQRQLRTRDREAPAQPRRDLPCPRGHPLHERVGRHDGLHARFHAAHRRARRRRQSVLRARLLRRGRS